MERERDELKTALRTALSEKKQAESLVSELTQLVKSQRNKLANAGEEWNALKCVGVFKNS